MDKSRLESTINAAGSVQQANFTPNSWKAFSEAMGNAQKVYADESSTQDQVDAAIKQLEEAQQTLVKKADTTELKTVLDQAQGVSGDLYTEASAKKLAEAVDLNSSQYRSRMTTRPTPSRMPSLETSRFPSLKSVPQSAAPAAMSSASPS